MQQLKQIRDKVTQALVAAAIPGVDDKVYSTRARRAWPDEGDFICVYTQNSDFDDQDTNPTIYQVETDVVVQVVVQQAPTGQDLEDRMDEITDKAVRALLQVHDISGPFDGTLEWFFLRGIRPTLSAEGEVLKFSQSVIFSGRWKAILPDAVPDADFLRMGSTLGGPDNASVDDLDTIFISDMRTP
jgi:hypothetical protein